MSSADTQALIVEARREVVRQARHNRRFMINSDVLLERVTDALELESARVKGLTDKIEALIAEWESEPAAPKYGLPNDLAAAEAAQGEREAHIYQLRDLLSVDTKEATNVPLR